MSVKNRITVNLEDDEYRALLEISAKADRSLAWLGRHAICQLLQREAKEVEGTSRSAGRQAGKDGFGGCGAQ